MLILSLDCAGSGCGACLWKDGTVLVQAEETMERGQDRRLIPLVNEVMKSGGVEFSDLARIAVTRGPGSFTGLRIGVAAARGLGFAAGKPVIGIDRFAVYRAQTQVANKNLLVVINSRRTELYCQYFAHNAPATEPNMMTAEQIAVFVKGNGNTTVTGDMAVPGIDGFLAASEKETVVAAALAAKADPADPAYLPRPLYIRPPDVTMPAGVRSA